MATGSEQIGMVATPSAMRGYYGPEKTEKTVRVIGGVDGFPGDYAKLESAVQ